MDPENRKLWCTGAAVAKESLGSSSKAHAVLGARAAANSKSAPRPRGASQVEDASGNDGTTNSMEGDADATTCAALVREGAVSTATS